MIQGWKENDGIQGIVAGLRPGPEEKNTIIAKIIVENKDYNNDMFCYHHHQFCYYYCESYQSHHCYYC